MAKRGKSSKKSAAKLKKPEQKAKAKPKFQQVILALAIAIVLVAFVMYGISVIYEKPDWEDYCPEKLHRKQYTDQASCESAGGLWSEDRTRPCPEGVECPQGWCDATYTCRKEYESVREVYERNVFFVAAPIGLAVLIIGLLLRLAAVSAGISIGGVVLIAIAVIRYWNELGKYVRLLLLGALLVILIWLAYKRFGNKKGGK